jgi:uncharacterized protein YjiS (DUF1127 family)
MPQVPATPSFSTAASSVLRRALAEVGERLGALAMVLAHRRAAVTLAELDPHLLRDIGLTRSDVIEAIERPMREDPTAHLADLVRERRSSRSALKREVHVAWR